MTAKEILEYNKRCSDFLGAYFCNDDLETFPNGYWKINNDKIDLPLHLKDMQFHSDWNLIMEVIFKINMLPNSKDPSDTTLQTHRVNVQSTVRSANKEAVVTAINKFLIWYNEDKK
jgi:hypothetical protein